MRFASFGLTAVVLTLALPVHADDIKVIGGGAMAGAVNQLGQEFEKATGHKLVGRFGATGAMRKLITSGTEFDVAVLERAVMNDLVQSGFVAKAPLTGFARVGMAVAVRSRSSKPDIGTVESFRRTLLQAKTITYAPEGATGAHLAKVFERLGITEQMTPKTKPQSEARLSLESLARGEAELGFAVSNNILAVKGVEVAGLFPEDIQYWVVTALGVAVKTKHEEAARALIAYLTSNEVAAVLKTNGLSPAKSLGR